MKNRRRGCRGRQTFCSCGQDDASLFLSHKQARTSYIIIHEHYKNINCVALLPNDMGFYCFVCRLVSVLMCSKNNTNFVFCFFFVCFF